jgi:hypothetical protein
MKPYRLFVITILVLAMIVPSVITEAAATRISFAAGATSAYLANRSINASGTVDYVLGAAINQYMSVGISAAQNADVRFSVYGMDSGTWLVNSVTGWRGVLPRTQDYLIRVTNLSGFATTYNLGVEIPARISFARGAYSATLQDYADIQESIAYVLWGRAGQTMNITVTSTNNVVGLAVYDAAGTPLKRYEVGTPSFSFVLPASGDYFIKAVGLSQTAGAYYTLYVSIV